MGNPHIFYRILPLTEDVIQAVADEAAKAHEKHGRESILFGSDDKAFRILAEEVGEVATAMNELGLGNISPEEYDSQVYAELTQVAAMAMSWMAKMDRQGVVYERSGNRPTP